MNLALEMFHPDTELSMSQAAQLAGMHKDSIRNRVKAGDFPGAYADPRNGHGRWLIPITDLVTAGLLDRDRVRPRAVEPTHELLELARLRSENAALKSELEFLRSLLTAKVAS